MLSADLCAEHRAFAKRSVEYLHACGFEGPGEFWWGMAFAYCMPDASRCNRFTNPAILQVKRYLNHSSNTSNMALTTAVHDSLPYIDSEPTPAERAAAQALIEAELPSSKAQSHPLLPPLRPQHFSPYMEAEVLRVQNNQPLSAINLSLYEALEPPATSPDSDKKHPETLRKWREALSKAYTSHAYLTSRQNNLHLLEQFGKNSWLISNSQLEDILRDLERELAERKTEIDLLVVERKNAQEAVSGEVNSLEQTWKRGVSRVLETEVAAEGVRRDILDVRASGIQAGSEMKRGADRENVG
jgi:pre-mRNA-splicing factor SPF27